MGVKIGDRICPGRNLLWVGLVKVRHVWCFSLRQKLLGQIIDAGICGVICVADHGADALQFGGDTVGVWMGGYDGGWCNRRREFRFRIAGRGL